MHTNDSNIPQMPTKEQTKAVLDRIRILADVVNPAYAMGVLEGMSSYSSARILYSVAKGTLPPETAITNELDKLIAEKRQELAELHRKAQDSRQG